MSNADRLQDLEDRLALTDLVSRLARWLDGSDFDAAPPLFTGDVAVRTPGGEAQGVEHVVAQARRTHAAATTQHVMANVLAEVDGDAASVGADLLVTFRPVGQDGPPTFASGSRYRFGAARTDAGWRFTRIEVYAVWDAGERPVTAPVAA